MVLAKRSATRDGVKFYVLLLAIASCVGTALVVHSILVLPLLLLVLLPTLTALRHGPAAGAAALLVGAASSELGAAPLAVVDLLYFFSVGALLSLVGSQLRRRTGKLADLAALYETALTELSEGVAMWDHRGTLLRCNATFKDFVPFASVDAPEARDLRNSHEEIAIAECLSTIRSGSAERLSREIMPNDREVVSISCRVAHRNESRIGSVIVARRLMDRDTLFATTRSEVTIELSDIGTFSWELSGEILELNPRSRELLRIGPEERFTYAQFCALVHPNDREHVDRAVMECARHGAIHDTEFRILFSDGVIRWVHARARRFVMGAEGWLHGVMRDITRKKQQAMEREQLLADTERARRSAEDANRLKDEFLATLSHELRTPLNAVLGWAQLLGQGRLPLEKMVETAAIIERNAESQAKIISDLLDMSRVISGRVTLEKQVVSLASLVVDAVDAASADAFAKGIIIECDLDHSVPVVGDPARLRQIAQNLLSNAVKFTERGGSISVCVDGTSAGAVLTVKDSGIGVSRSAIPHLFDRHSHARIGKNSNGRGLGLAMVKHLVALHQGAIRCESEGPGRGANFVVTLPLSDVSANSRPAASIVELPEAEESALGGVKVLVVDDEPDAADLVAYILRDVGADVKVAYTVESALTLFDAFHPAVLVSDLSMPQRDGYDLIRTVRSRSGYPVPAIAVSAFAREVDRSRARAAGFTTHLPKPVNARELLMEVTALASQQHTLRSTSSAA
jgi:PAS domain S-box-containing protein